MATEDEWNKNLTEKLKEISMLMKMMNPLIHKNVNEYMKVTLIMNYNFPSIVKINMHFIIFLLA